MDPQTFFAVIAAAFVHQVLWLLPLVLAVAALPLLTPRIRGARGEAQVGRVLARLFPAVRHDLILPDGRGGLTQVDHLALTPAGLLVVETKNYRGAILGRARERQWRQSFGRRRGNAIQNPLHQNYGHLQAVQALELGVPVIGRVVFTDDSRFPQGRPEGVSQLATLAEDLTDLRCGEVSPRLQDAWQRLQRHVRTDQAARKAHRRQLHERFGPDRKQLAAFVLLGLATLSAGWLWLTRETARVPVWPSATQVSPRPLPAPHDRYPVRPVVATLPGTSDPPPQTPRPQQISIQWADPGRTPFQSQACKLAIAALLEANTPEHRAERTRLCGQRN